MLLTNVNKYGVILTRTRTHTRTHERTHTQTHTHTHACTYVHTRSHAHTQTYIHTHIRTHTHTHTTHLARTLPCTYKRMCCIQLRTASNDIRSFECFLNSSYLVTIQITSLILGYLYQLKAQHGRFYKKSNTEI